MLHNVTKLAGYQTGLFTQRHQLPNGISKVRYQGSERFNDFYVRIGDFGISLKMGCEVYC